MRGPRRQARAAGPAAQCGAPEGFKRLITHTRTHTHTHALTHTHGQKEMRARRGLASLVWQGVRHGVPLRQDSEAAVRGAG